ncbi:MAG: hypothetical protein L0Z70_11115, partial [Chloroflexi bacterium]|nr:hypothetical protein [Chloroflexota bacterium]
MGFAMNRQGGEGGTSLPRSLALQAGGEANRAGSADGEALLHLAVCAQLLSEKSAGESAGEARLAFRHQLLQEYFAARRLLEMHRRGQDIAAILSVPWQLWQFRPRRLGKDEPLEEPPTCGWEEAAPMAASLAGSAAARLCRAVARANLPLAGRCLAEADAEREDLRDLAGELRGSLLARQRSRRAHLRARIAAGLALGELRHPELLPQ